MSLLTLRQTISKPLPISRHLYAHALQLPTRRLTSPHLRLNISEPTTARRTFSSNTPRPQSKWLYHWRTVVALERLPSRLRTFAKYTAFVAGSSVLGLFALTGAIFLHDAFTYHHKNVDFVPTEPLALNPERGGPKNLPILRSYLSDIEDSQQSEIAKKPRLVIVGGGWGAVSVLENLRPEDYHVTVVSSDTYTTFTPLLPSAAVGTVMARSLVEPLRKIISRLRGHLLHAKAVDLVMSERLLEVEVVSPVDGRKHVYVPYDKLVIAVGSTSARHGVPGIEHCFQLKTIGDAQRIRQRIVDNFEVAALPTTAPDARKRLLSFVICGGGPTGIETAAEIYDLCQEDIMDYYPKLCRKDVSITVIQSRDHILNGYSEAISNFAEEKFHRDGVTVVTNARVAAVHPGEVEYTVKRDDGKVDKYTLPSNMILWSTGIAMNPFTARVSSLLPNQVHKKAIVVDAHLRVKGAPIGEIYAIGDASTLETSIVDHLLDLVDRSDKNKDGKIDFNEWEHMVEEIKRRFPMSSQHLQKVRELFELYDSDADNSLTLNELAVLLHEVGNKITALPATAQVASQQGKYLGKKLTKLAKRRRNGASTEPQDEEFASPFKYKHLGSLAYVGNAAVFDFGKYSFTGGLLAMYAWRSVYWSEQFSARTRALLMMDWTIRGIWGRDLSRLQGIEQQIP